MLIDCIDNVNNSEYMMVGDNRVLDGGVDEKSYVKSNSDGTHAICVVDDYDLEVGIDFGTDLLTMPDSEIAKYLRNGYETEYETENETPILVLPYGANTELAGFQYIYDIDLLNVLTRGGNFVIARENSLIIYENNELRTLPYGFNWFIDQVKRICGNVTGLMSKRLVSQIKKLCVKEYFSIENSYGNQYNNPYNNNDNLMNQCMYGECDINYSIRELVRMIYGDILRNNDYVLYGWLAPFYDFGISLVQYVSRVGVSPIHDLIIVPPIDYSQRD